MTCFKADSLRLHPSRWFFHGLLHPRIRPKGDADHLSCRNQCSPVASRSKTAEDLPGKLGIFDTFGGAVEAQKMQVGYGREEIIIFSSPFVRIPTPDHSLKLDGGGKRGRTLRPVIWYLSTQTGFRQKSGMLPKLCFFGHCQVLKIWMIDNMLIMIAYIVKLCTVK